MAVLFDPRYGEIVAEIIGEPGISLERAITIWQGTSDWTFTTDGLIRVHGEILQDTHGGFYEREYLTIAEDHPTFTTALYMVHVRHMYAEHFVSLYTDYQAAHDKFYELYKAECEQDEQEPLIKLNTDANTILLADFGDEEEPLCEIIELIVVKQGEEIEIP